MSDVFVLEFSGRPSERLLRTNATPSHRQLGSSAGSLLQHSSNYWEMWRDVCDIPGCHSPLSKVRRWPSNTRPIGPRSAASAIAASDLGSLFLLHLVNVNIRWSLPSRRGRNKLRIHGAVGPVGKQNSIIHISCGTAGC